MTLAVALIVSATSALAVDPNGFTTEQDPMLDDVMEGVEIAPILTVGDELPNGYRFEAIPDGISVRVGTGGQIELFVNHETSKVPFPFNTAAPTEANGESDFDNAQVSLLTLDPDGSVLDGSFVIPSSEGFQRFCSNYLATAARGSTATSCSPTRSRPTTSSGKRTRGRPRSGTRPRRRTASWSRSTWSRASYHLIYGMGRHNHENAVRDPRVRQAGGALRRRHVHERLIDDPGRRPLAGGVEAGAISAVLLHGGEHEQPARRQGQPLCVRVGRSERQRLLRLHPGSTPEVSGRFIKVPKNIATGLNKDGTEIKAADVGYPLPPTDGSWQRDLRSVATATTPQIGIDGPQWVLEYWSQLNNVFQFVRVEDIAYDKRPGMENVVYVVDSGRGTAGDPQAGRSTNGRVWRMELDPDNPRNVDSLSVFVEGDDQPGQDPE